MISKLVLLGCFAFLLQRVDSLAIDKDEKDSNDESREKMIKEAIKGFVELVDLYNLNVSLIATHEKHYPYMYRAKEQMGVTLKMPVNNVSLTEPTLDDNKQDKYLKHFKKYAEQLGIKTRIIKIENGESQVVNEKSVGETRLIHSDSYDWLTEYHEGRHGYVFPKDKSHEIIYNFINKDPDDYVKNIKIVTGNIIVSEKKVTDDFPKAVLEEAKKVIPRLFISIADESILSRVLAEHLDTKFNGTHQVMVGVDHFSVTGSQYANLDVANTNIVIFIRLDLLDLLDLWRP